MKISNPFADYYSTTDIYLSASLIASGYKLLDIIKREKQFSFFFDSTKNLDNSISEYWEGKMRVDAKTLFNTFKELKTRMYNQNYE